MKLSFRDIKKTPQEIKTLNTVVFIDYEYLFISFKKIFKVSPVLSGILDEIKQYGKIQSIKVFGDFTKNEISQERNRIRTITSDIIDCGNETLETKKDFTDFIMLDHIYRETIQNTAVQQFILFTGDGHFSSAATFLRTFMDKIVGIYGITQTFSQQLNECATWSKFIEVVDDDIGVYTMNLIKNFQSAQSRNVICTFKKTVDHVQRNYGGETDKYEYALQQLISDGYVTSEVCTAFADGTFKMLVPQWAKIETNLLPSLKVS
ncbi:MAG: NYN domain-containing protein [Firmicutes bacterium]|nr:NYN domain-containing protein [Bacillota bacterium]